MATYNGIIRSLAYYSGPRDYALAGSVSAASSFFANSVQFRPVPGPEYALGVVTSPNLDVPRGTWSPIFPAGCFVLNRGRNTGSGPAYVYWFSPDAQDPTGIYYTLSTPFSQLTDIMWASTVFPGIPPEQVQHVPNCSTFDSETYGSGELGG
jgi:hypothetical protein